MECKHSKTEDLWNDDGGFYQKIDTCTLSKKRCQGSEGVCSEFEAKEEKVKEEVKKMPEEQEKPEEEEKKEGE